MITFLREQRKKEAYHTKKKQLICVELSACFSGDDWLFSSHLGYGSVKQTSLMKNIHVSNCPFRRFHSIISTKNSQFLHIPIEKYAASANRATSSPVCPYANTFYAAVMPILLIPLYIS